MVYITRMSIKSTLTLERLRHKGSYMSVVFVVVGLGFLFICLFNANWITKYIKSGEVPDMLIMPSTLTF